MIPRPTTSERRPDTHRGLRRCRYRARVTETTGAGGTDYAARLSFMGTRYVRFPHTQVIRVLLPRLASLLTVSAPFRTMEPSRPTRATKRTCVAGQPRAPVALESGPPLSVVVARLPRMPLQFLSPIFPL